MFLPAAGRSEMMFGDIRKGNSTAVFQVSLFKAKTHSDSESLELFSEHCDADSVDSTKILSALIVENI